ncbi:MAG: 50S ribosomal protein L4 [Armatimonadetes bacterium RBG_19FT_COMBO_69_19]|nr:MAG: 50S ribosomal protein L4 [Armatimonadetes bacterium RBG_19FT_COMBO_69_19]
MARAQVFDVKGKDVGTVDLPEAVFGITPHTAVMHEVLVAQLAGRRTGTHSTKTRGEVAGSTRKIYRQKGTGRARHGSKKAPIFRGGGITFGPRPRDFAQDTPKKVRRLAVRSALSAKAADGKVIVVESLQLEAPKTSAVAELLDRLPVAGKTLIVTPAPEALLVRSAANLPQVKVIAAASLNVHDVLATDYVVLTKPAVDAVAEVLTR